MSDIDPVKELRELLEKTTPGPWEVTGAERVVIATVPLPPPDGSWRFIGEVTINTEGITEEERANAALIAAAYNHLPALLTALSSHRARIERLEERIDELAAEALANGDTGKGDHWYHRLHGIEDCRRALAALTPSGD